MPGRESLSGRHAAGDLALDLVGYSPAKTVEESEATTAAMASDVEGLGRDRDIDLPRRPDQKRHG